MIGRNHGGLHGDAGLGVWNAALRCVSATPFRGWLVNLGVEEPAMFKLPAYDPVGIAMLGFGILAVVALAFAF